MPRKGKVPKRINKAVRERIICEHLNELFIELADSLELNQQNSGRSLINGHTCLLSDSNYVTTEKNELQGRNISARDRDT
ncbi:unnamed protein product [Brassica oleracea var. botrytis]|uniref:Iron-related transcription factor 3 bHLH domain-containing protein n=1 Tax=Brassica oleracea TaxID=3712 RepID=A0A3P6FV87_BRAOL|nr:unnamed protein product [Brassica oleracea]